MPPRHRIYGLRRPVLEPIALASLAPGAALSWFSASGTSSWWANPTVVLRWPDRELLLHPMVPSKIPGHLRWLVGWARRHGAATQILRDLREVQSIWSSRVSSDDDGRVVRFLRRMSRLHGGYWSDGTALYDADAVRVTDPPVSTLPER